MEKKNRNIYFLLPTHVIFYVYPQGGQQAKKFF